MSKAGFGEHLKREREMRGVTLEEICSATRIGTRFLEALENEEWDRLPGGVFNRGFVRAVARFLGLDEDGLVAEYALAMSEHSGVPASMWASQPAHQQLAGHWPANPAPNWMLRIGVLAAVMILGGVGWLGWRRYGLQTPHAADRIATSPSAPGAAPGPNSTSPSSTSPSPNSSSTDVRPDFTGPPLGGDPGAPSIATPATGAPSAHSAPAISQLPATPSAAAPGSAPPASTPAEAAQLQLNIEAAKATTISIAADGRQIFRGSMIAGQSRTFTARNRFEVRAHDAGALSLQLNGQNVAMIGRPGRAGHVALTRHDLKSASGGPD